jgi:tetratricopeptide (TPR) repeat protein
LRKTLETIHRELKEEATFRNHLQRSAPKDQRENTLHIFQDQALHALLLSREYPLAIEIGRRLLRVSFDLPSYLACAHYVLWRAYTQTGKPREGDQHLRKLASLATAQAPGEVHLFLAYYYRDVGRKDLEEAEYARAVAKNPALRGLKR